MLCQALTCLQVPFRETHHISGRTVALAESEGCQLSDLTYNQLREIDTRFEEDVIAVFDYEASVERRDAVGGPARKRFLEQITHITKTFG